MRAAGGDRGLLQRPQARGGLARVEDPRRPGLTSATACTQRAASVATPDRRCRKFSAVRSAVSSAAARPRDAQHLAALAPDSLVHHAADLAPRGPARGTPARRRRAPNTTPGAFWVISASARGVGRDGRRGGHVTGADVLGQGPVHDLGRCTARPSREHRQPRAHAVFTRGAGAADRHAAALRAPDITRGLAMHHDQLAACVAPRLARPGAGPAGHGIRCRHHRLRRAAAQCPEARGQAAAAASVVKKYSPDINAFFNQHATIHVGDKVSFVLRWLPHDRHPGQGRQRSSADRARRRPGQRRQRRRRQPVLVQRHAARTWASTRCCSSRSGGQGLQRAKRIDSGLPLAATVKPLGGHVHQGRHVQATSVTSTPG